MIVSEVPVIFTVELPAVIVPPAKLKSPEMVWVALARVMLPESVTFKSVCVPEVSVPVPFIINV